MFQGKRPESVSVVTIPVRNVFSPATYAFPASSGQIGGQQTGNGPGIPTIREKPIPFSRLLTLNNALSRVSKAVSRDRL